MANGKITVQRVKDVSSGHVRGRTRPLVAKDGLCGGHEWHCEHNHGHDGEDQDNKSVTEVTEDLGDFQEKVTPHSAKRVGLTEDRGVMRRDIQML